MSTLSLVILVGLQGLVGAYLWRVISGPRSMTIIELAGMGLGLGTAVAVVAGWIGMWLPMGSWARTWSWALPAVLVAIVWIIRRLRNVTLPRCTRASRGEVVAVVLGLALGGAIIAGNLRNYPLAGGETWDFYHQDMVFFEALATGTSRFSPSDSVFMVGQDIRYHWLTYAWAGQLAQSIATQPFEVLTRALPAVSLLGTTLIAASWTRRLTDVQWAPTLSVLLIVSGGYVGAVYGAILNFDSPSQALTTLWLLVLLVGLLAALRGGNLIVWAAFGYLMSLVVAGGKFSTIVVAAGGFGLVTLVGFATRASWRWRAAALSLMGIAAILTVFFLMVSGSAQAGGLGVWSLSDRAASVQGLNPQVSSAGVIIGTALLVVAIAARWAGLFWLLARKATRGQPETVLGAGLAVVGLSSVALLSGGFNDMWFALAASAPLSVLSSVGVASFAISIREAGISVPFRGMSILVLTAGMGSAVIVSVIWGTGDAALGGWRWISPVIGLLMAAGLGLLLAWTAQSSGMALLWRWLGFSTALLVVMSAVARPLYLAADRILQPPVGPHDIRIFAPLVPFVASRDTESLTMITPGERAAGSFLRERATVGDIVATNVTYSPLVPALTGLRTYVSGIHFQAPYGRPDHVGDLLQREELSWDFIDTPSERTLLPLCQGGIRWVWIDRSNTRIDDWAPWGVVRFDDGGVVILELEKAYCDAPLTSQDSA